MSTKAQRMVGHTDKNNSRAENDFYETPRKATIGLLEKEKFSKMIWEPACGFGAISEVLKENGYNVFSTDLIARGYENSKYRCDFLETNGAKSQRDIITNPPFSLATEFILHAKKIANQKIAIFGRINLLEGVDRYNKIWCEEANKDFPLSKIFYFVDRQTCLRPDVTKGSGLIFFAWFIWDREHMGLATSEWIYTKENTIQ